MIITECEKNYIRFSVSVLQVSFVPSFVEKNTRIMINARILRQKQ